MLDKIKGALYGVAIGDALGATTEFMTKEEIQEQFGKVTEFIGGGPSQLEPGEVTDDTEMTIALIKGIMANSTNPIDEIGKQFIYWKNSGPKDIGIATDYAITNYKGDWFKAAETAHHLLQGRSAGNGSLMRCLPIALAYSDSKKIEDISCQQSKITHYDDLAAEACVIYNKIAHRIFNGEDLKSTILEEIKGTRYDTSYDAEPNCLPDGFVVHTMRWAFYWLLTCETFEEVVIGATNMGYDTETIAAIAGGLKGLEDGYSNLPIQYKGNLDRKNIHQLNAYANILLYIRDKNTVGLRKNSENIINELKNQVNQLNDMVEKDEKQDIQSTLNAINKSIYMSRLSINESDSEFDEKFHTWRMAENRYLRTNLLIDLNAPKFIKIYEISWLATMIDHMDKRHKGIEPKFTEEQLEELENQIRSQSIFD